MPFAHRADGRILNFLLSYLFPRAFETINLFEGDQHAISLHDINTIKSKEVTRIWKSSTGLFPQILDVPRSTRHSKEASISSMKLKS